MPQFTFPRFNHVDQPRRKREQLDGWKDVRFVVWLFEIFVVINSAALDDWIFFRRQVVFSD